MSKTLKPSRCISIMAPLMLIGCSHMTRSANEPIAHDQHLQIIDTIDLKEVSSKAISLATQHGSQHILVIFDIDNTLLTMPQDLGGDGWFGWQAELLDKKPNSKDLSVRDFSGLIFLQGVFFSIGQMQLTQRDIPPMISSLQELNISTLAITARGSEFRGSTIRELNHAGLTFSNAPQCAAPLCANRGLIKSEAISKAVELLSPEPNNILQGHHYRDVTVSDGVVMLAGQDKGLFLDLLLESFPHNKYTHILIADDSKKNIDNYAKAAPFINANLTLYHYTRVQNSELSLQDSVERQQKASSSTKRIGVAVCSAIKSTWCELPSSK